MGRERPGDMKRASFWFPKANHKGAPQMRSSQMTQKNAQCKLKPDLQQLGVGVECPEKSPKWSFAFVESHPGGMSEGSLGFLRTLAPLRDSIPVAIGDPVCGSDQVSGLVGKENRRKTHEGNGVSI